MNVHLSPYGRASIQPSPVSRMMEAFANDFRDGVDINLGVGYVNEKTIPVALLTQAMQAVAGDPLKYRQAFNYGGPAGSANLVGALRRFLAGPAGGPLDEASLARRRLIVGPCGATSILDGLAEVIAPGIVVTSDPMYYIYCEALERKGFEVLAVPEDEEGLDVVALERKLEALDVGRLAFFYVVTVNNPSCAILSNTRRRALLLLAAKLSRQQERLIPVFYDLAYELLLHDPEAGPLVSVLPEDDLGIAYEIGTLSKVLAPGLRIGYLAGPDGPLMKAMVQRTSDLGFSAPVFVQEMSGYLLDHHAAEQLCAVNAGYREKAVAVRKAIGQSLGDVLEECRGGRAGFYFYLTFRDIETHTGSPFFRFLTRTTGSPAVDGAEGNRFPRVMYIPGEYCVHPRGDLVAKGRRQLRLSYGFEDTATILRALASMREAVEFARQATVPATR
jgi:2-aminoadipate transaminase